MSRAQQLALGATEATLPDGTWLRFRPLGPADRDGLAALFDRMSPLSRHRRYLTPKPRLTPRELAYLTDVDHVRHEAIAAVDRRDGAIVGVARYVTEPGETRVAEVAVEVADDFQHQGIGTALTEITVERARANGFRLLTATTLWDNGPARALLRRLHFRTWRSRGREIELKLVLDSEVPKPMPAPAAPQIPATRTPPPRAPTAPAPTR